VFPFGRDRHPAGRYRHNPLMDDHLEVQAARIPDRDRLLEELRKAGLDARPVDEVGIEVPLDADAEEAAVEVLAHAESVIMRTGSSFVPIKHEGTIYIRPPLS
ncbi:MAG TPA: hypothetical protein VE055_00065, partial [Gaiellaceae bacterium]|nr:hypothetical protein [Gaiellaceae bacterium]